MDHTVIAARVKAAHATLTAMGFPKAMVALEFEAWPYVGITADRPRAMVGIDVTERLLFESFDTVEQALDAIDFAIRTAPHKWTATDIAATLGLPICEACDEAPATTTLHDPADAAHYGVTNVALCEPCLDRARDRETERAMEG
jgi:hypothetical protein